jgi:hypothetical protein
MPGLFRRRPAEPSFVTAPVERPVDESRIAQLDERTFAAFREGNKALADNLIDLRNAIRRARPASVPVIPGRMT